MSDGLMLLCKVSQVLCHLYIKQFMSAFKTNRQLKNQKVLFLYRASTLYPALIVSSRLCESTFNFYFAANRRDRGH